MILKKNKKEDETTADEVTESKPQSREERIIELEGIIQKNNEGIAETSKEIAKLLKAKEEADRLHAEHVQEVLIANPDSSVKGQIELAYKVTNQKLTQLQDSLSKMQLLKGSYVLAKNKASNELAEIQKQIKEEELDKAAVAIFQGLEKWISDYNQAMSTFSALRGIVLSSPERLGERAQRCGYDVTYQLIYESHFNRSSLETLSMDQLADAIVKMGTGGPGSYDIPPKLQITDKPIPRREGYIKNWGEYGNSTLTQNTARPMTAQEAEERGNQAVMDGLDKMFGPSPDDTKPVEKVTVLKRTPDQRRLGLAPSGNLVSEEGERIVWD